MPCPRPKGQVHECPHWGTDHELGNESYYYYCKRHVRLCRRDIHPRGLEGAIRTDALMKKPRRSCEIRLRATHMAANYIRPMTGMSEAATVTCLVCKTTTVLERRLLDAHCWQCLCKAMVSRYRAMFAPRSKPGANMATKRQPAV